MIIVTGDIVTSAEHAAEAAALALAHTQRSRLEPGCVSHDVSVDAGNPQRLLFVERWESADALRAHFAVPETRTFAKALGGFAVGRPSMQIYEAAEIKLG